MSFVPRWYQAEGIAAGVKFLTESRGQNGLMIEPTGSGKSLMIAGIIKEIAAPTLVFQPSKEILAQNAAKYRAYGYPCGIYSASAGEKRMADVTFATIGSVVRKQHLLERFKYVIVDECHGVNSEGGMLEEVLGNLGRPILGLTATPYRLTKISDVDPDGKAVIRSKLMMLNRTNPRTFDKIIHYVQNRVLFDEGYLAKLDYRSVRVINRAALQRNKTGGDFTDESVGQEYARANMPGKVVKVVRRLLEIGRKRVLVFTRFTEESRAVVAAIPGAAMVTATTPDKERDRLTRLFGEGKIKVMVNVGIYTTGVDWPKLDTVVMAKPTMSLALWYQVIGRCVRPHPDKEFAMIVDMGGNLEQFGKVEDLTLSDKRGWHIHGADGRILTGVPFGDKSARVRA